MSQAVFSAAAAAHDRPVLGQCRWPIEIVSRTRELDLTECFENGVLLPVPLLLTLVLALAQLFRARRRLSKGVTKWIDRGSGETVYRYKSVCLSGRYD